MICKQVKICEWFIFIPRVSANCDTLYPLYLVAVILVKFTVAIVLSFCTASYITPEPKKPMTDRKETMR